MAHNLNDYQTTQIKETTKQRRPLRSTLNQAMPNAHGR